MHDYFGRRLFATSRATLSFQHELFRTSRPVPVESPHFAFAIPPNLTPLADPGLMATRSIVHQLPQGVDSAVEAGDFDMFQALDIEMVPVQVGMSIDGDFTQSET